ncbi:hypothetical protein CPB83DRAFT_845199 [Crepidotus variabilis]|uniref:DOMON domain-containing protein n=1 Tax=Crepidotus variabilis TaxID=179855 RepID=A0A9P6EQW0_9AGAR|nr:hypothetical protein CPB83DRAFT_845199 [Crepidotus variabilis]
MRLSYLHALLGCFLRLQSIPSSWALKGEYVCRTAVCVVATVENDVVTYEVTPRVPQLGWVAVGFGEHMAGTHSVILWKNADGTTTLSQRYADGYSEPKLVDSPPRLAKLVEPKHLLPTSASSTTFAFQVSANSNSSNATPENHIFAFSEIPPKDKSPSASISRHQQTGYMSFNFAKDFVAPKASSGSHSTGQGHASTHENYGLKYSRMEKLIILHALLVSFGFLVLLPAGSLIGRYGRVYTPRWFKLHWTTNFGIAGPVITLGALLGPAVVWSKQSFRTHLANGHERFGVVLLLVYYAQVYLGRYIHARRNQLAKQGPIKAPHPPLNILHIVLGVSIIGLSFFQVRSGLQWWEALTGRGAITPWAWPLWHIWGLVFFVAYFVGYAFLPRQLRMEREAAYAPVPEADGPLDERRLLGEDNDA